MTGEGWLAALRVRRAEATESGAVAALWLRSRRASVPANAPHVHTDEEVRDHFALLVAGAAEVWVAEHPTDGLVAVLSLHDGWVDDLHVEPGYTGRGVGSLLIAFAKARAGGELDLWTFQANVGARRFYERHGFVKVAMTDGDNEEHAPDVRYRWSPPGTDWSRAGASGERPGSAPVRGSAA